MPAEKILIKNGTLLTLNSQSNILHGDMLIHDGRIEQIGKDLDSTAAIVFEAGDYIVMPGFVQTHVHLCQTLFRNLADDLGLLDWLQKRIWPFEGRHTEDTLRVSARLGIA
jgi:5-methylthioadenosine/S-adenosylhomocysteine deaminase